MNLHLIPAISIVYFLFCSFISIWLISCGMRTAPVFIPEQKAKQTISDLKVQQRDNRVRLSWKINQNERVKRLKKFDFESGEGDYFLIHQKMINLDCRECEPNKMNDVKIMIPSDQLIQDGNQVFFYLQVPEKSLKINYYQISHCGPKGEIFSQSKSIRLRMSNVFPKLPSPELEIVQIEDQSQILRFPFGKVVQRKKIEMVDVPNNRQLKETEKKDKSKDINLQIQRQLEFKSYTIRITWPRILSQSLKGLKDKGDYFEGQELFRNHLYRTLNTERWPETPINIESSSDNYFLDILRMQVTPLNTPLSVDTHPDVLPPRILFYIDLSVKYLDTWRYKFRLVDSFGNESEASESVSFNLPKTTIFANNFGEKILVPHTD